MAIKDEFELHHVKNMAYFSKFFHVVLMKFQEK